MTSNNHQTDAELVERFKKGDIQSLNKLVKRRHLEFCKKAYGLVGDKNIASDVAQETWRIIICKINELNHPERFLSWALRILYIQSIDALRIRAREHKKTQQYQLSHIDHEEVKPDINEDLKSRLRKAINALPAKQQHVIRLFYVEEYSVKEIAKILEVKPGTVKSRLFHAREKLKQLLK